MNFEMENLIVEYQESLRCVRLALRAAQGRSGDQAKADCGQLRSMERELLWTLEYLESGRVPDYHRGIYKCVVPMDPQKMASMVKARRVDSGSAEWRSTDYELEKRLSILTPREREAFVLVRGQGCSHSEAAEYMTVHRGTVNVFLRRAERKLRRSS